MMLVAMPDEGFGPHNVIYSKSSIKQPSFVPKVRMPTQAGIINRVHFCWKRQCQGKGWGAGEKLTANGRGHSGSACMWGLTQIPF